MPCKKDRPITLPNGQVILVGHRFKDISGQVFGRLTILGPCGYTTEGQAKWTCRCQCGKVAEIRGARLRNGGTKSCGCLSVEKVIARSTKHNLAHRGEVIPEYRVWNTMKLRCNNPNIEEYPRYGGRGIVVCERWSESFAAFIEDIGRRPSSRHSIDRINTNGNYEPGNCRWALPSVQQNNRRDNRFITHQGKTRTMAEWARDLGMHVETLFGRLKRGWSEVDALTTPVRPRTTPSPA